MFTEIMLCLFIVTNSDLLPYRRAKTVNVITVNICYVTFQTFF